METEEKIDFLRWVVRGYNLYINIEHNPHPVDEEDGELILTDCDGKMTVEVNWYKPANEVWVYLFSGIKYYDTLGQWGGKGELSRCFIPYNFVKSEIDTLVKSHRSDFYWACEKKFDNYKKYGDSQIFEDFKKKVIENLDK